MALGRLLVSAPWKFPLFGEDMGLEILLEELLEVALFEPALLLHEGLQYFDFVLVHQYLLLSLSDNRNGFLKFLI